MDEFYTNPPPHQANVLVESDDDAETIQSLADLNASLASETTPHPGCAFLIRPPDDFVPQRRLLRVDEDGDAYASDNCWEYSAIVLSQYYDLEGGVEIHSNNFGLANDTTPTSLEHYPYFPGQTDLIPLVMARAYTPTGFGAFVNSWDVRSTGCRSAVRMDHVGATVYFYQNRDGLFQLYMAFFYRILGDFQLGRLVGRRDEGMLHLSARIEAERTPADAWMPLFDSFPLLLRKAPGYDWLPQVAIDSANRAIEQANRMQSQSGVPTSPKRDAAAAQGLTTEELDKKKALVEKERAKKRKQKADKTIYRLQSGVGGNPNAIILETFQDEQSPPLCLQGSVRPFYKSQVGWPNISLGVTPEINERLSEFSSHAQNVSSMIPQIAELLNGAQKDGIKHKFSLDATWLHVPAVCTLFAFAYMAVVEGGKWYAIGGAASIAYATTCAYAHKDWLLERLTKVFSRDPDQVRSQSFDLSIIEDLAGAFAGLLALNSTRVWDSSAQKFQAFLGSIKTFDRTKAGLSSAMSFGVQTVTRIINWFRSEFLGLDAIAAMSSSIPQLDAWVQKVDSLQREAFSGVLAVNSENSARVEALRVEGAHLALKKFANSEVHQVNTALRVYNDILKKINVPFERANLTGGGCRMEPVVILISGDPGVGKTFAMMPLLLKALEQILPQEQKDSYGNNYMDHVYPRCPEMKFWDGYRGQFATIYDDFGQARDVAGQPDTEFLELIRSGNIFPYPLHMADIADKGNTEFKSRIILCTSNLTQFSPNSIVSHEAVMRRFNLILKVFPKKEYCIDPNAAIEDRRLDKSNKSIQDGFHPEIYEFHVRHANKTEIGSDTSEILDFDQVVARIVSLYREASVKADAYLRCLDDIAKFKSQSGRPNSTEFIWDFARKFEQDSDVGMLDLDTILARAQPRREIMNLHQFHIWVRQVLTDKDMLDHFLKDPELYYHAFKVNELAFRKCIDTKPERLDDLVRALTVDYDEKVVKTITSKEVRALENARITLAEYSKKFRSHSSELLVKFNWIDHWKKALAIAAVVIGVIGKLGFFSWLRTLFPGASVLIDQVEEETMSPESGGPRMRHAQFKTKQSSTFKSEGGVDTGCVQMRDVIIGRNQYLLCYPPSGFKFGYVTFVDGRHLLMPHHFITRIRGLLDDGRLQTDSQLELHNYITDQVLKARPLDFEQGLIQSPLKSSDMALVYLAQAHTHRKIVSFFAQGSQLKNHDILPVQLCHGFKFEDKFGVSVHNTRAHRKVEQVIHNDDEDPFTVHDVMEYKAPTEEGDCGMLIIAHSSSFGPGKVLGFHIAGSQNAQGIGSVVTRECLEAILAKVPRKDFPHPEEGVDFKSQFGVSTRMPGFLEIGETKKAVTQPGSTSIRRSVLHNLWTVSPKAPATLRPREVDGVMVDPMYKAIANYASVKPAVDQQLFRVATQSLSSSMLTIMHESGARPRRYSFEESVLGVPIERYCKSVPRGTSAGFPYVLAPVPGFKGKEWYFGKAVDFDLTRPAAQKLKAECEKIIELALQGRRSEVIFVDVLKDELRKKERVRNAETRLISAAPIAYTIVCRMFFLAWAVCLTNNNLRVGVGVGINAYSEDWDFLARRLLSVGDFVLAGDFKGFDTSHGVFICYMVLWLINQFYQDSDDIVREVLFADIADSVHLCGSIVYVWINGGFPSGHFLTALLQSIANQILMRCAWIICHPRGVEGLPEFDKNVVHVSYGDDGLTSVSKYAIEFFNYHTIARAMTQLGYTYTDECKVGAGEGPPHRTLAEVAFLKRGFRYEPRLTRYVAPLAIESILEMLYWTKKGARKDLITKANVEIALRELSLHPKQDFQHWAPLVVAGAREHLEYHPQIQEYEVLQDLTCSLECIW